MNSAVYTVDSASKIDTPNPNCFTIFRLSTDGMFYAKLSNGSVVFLGSGSTSGVLLNNIIIPVGEGNAQLSSEETSLDIIQLSYDYIFTSLNFPNLLNVGIISLIKTALGSSNGIVSFPSLQSCLLLIIDDAELMTTFNIPLLENPSRIDINNCEDLTTINTHPSLKCTDIDLSANALNTATVDSILASLVAGGELNGNLDLSGGTNSAPTGGALNPNYVLLTGVRGWSVTINP